MILGYQGRVLTIRKGILKFLEFILWDCPEGSFKVSGVREDIQRCALQEACFHEMGQSSTAWEKIPLGDLLT